MRYLPARGSGRRESAGQFGAGRVVEPDVRGAEVLGEMGPGAGPRDEQDVRGEAQQPGERDLRRRRIEPYGQRGEHGVGEQPVPYLAWPAQRAERYESDVPRLALGEEVRRPLVGQVEEVLHTDDLGLGERSQEVPAGDVAEADAVDQPFLTTPVQR